MTEDEERRALANVDKVRGKYRVPFLSVMPDPACADNVRLRYRTGSWQVMHVVTAMDHVRMLRRRLMQQRVARYAK